MEICRTMNVRLYFASIEELGCLEYNQVVQMAARNQIELGLHLDDEEPIDPRWFIQSMPDSKQSLQTGHQISGNWKEQSQKSNSRRKISILCNPYEGELDSAKQTLREEDSVVESEESKQTFSLGKIASQLVHLRPNTKTSNILAKKKIKHELKEIISRQKVNVLCSKFIDKVKRNNMFSTPVEFTGFEIKDRQSFLQRSGFEINVIVDNGIALLSVLQISFLFLAYSLALVFNEIAQAQIVNTLQTFSLIFYLMEMAYTCVTVKSNAGKRLTTYRQILKYYLESCLIIDVVSVLILIIDSNSDFILMKYIRLFIIAKLPQCLEKIEKLEVFFIKNYHNQQYWSLIKVFLFNFCFAHILAVFLTGMANISSNNWHLARGISDAVWFQKYVWAYYWGCNIMLTVGFGDIVASTYQQAICLIFIEIVSVMCLAYNINWVGTLISNIRSQDIEKSKNLKTFKQLSDKYGLPDELEWKINNYIEESVNIRKKFNVEEENAFIGNLPSNLKKEYLKQSNRSVFHDLTFFGNLVDRTLYSFAEKIEMHISHPQQTLRRLDDEFNLLILRQGQIGYVARKRSCFFNDMVIDRVKVVEGQRPFLLGLEFISRKRPNYEIKATEYSVIYFMEFENLINTLKDSQMDYLHYCFLRDRNKSVLDEFEVLPCEYCKRNHTKFTCPKLHFTPIPQLTIYKEQQKEKSNKNKRFSDDFIRNQEPKIKTLKNYMQLGRQMKNQKKSAGKNTSKLKLMNPFLDRLDQIKKLKADTLIDDSSHNLQEFFLKNTSQIIKQEFNRFIRTESFEDEVWIIHSDKMKNYKEYFQEHNPCNLEDNFNLEVRLERQRSNRNQNDSVLRNNSNGHFRSLSMESKDMKSLPI